jgi:predicted metal-dependent enzyme (double-stranded beta helix superfamily)
MRTNAEPARLSRAQLRALAAGVASDDRLWRHLVRHEPERRTYEELLIEEPLLLLGRVALWLICWMDDHDTGFHDHGTSSGAVAVASGRLRDERLTIAGPPRIRTYRTAETFDFGPSDIHRMSHAGGGPAVSIHAYSPPLGRMGSYVIEPDGVLRRTQIPYTEELRPGMQAAA